MNPEDLKTQREADLQRIERGDPQPWGEAIILAGLGVAVAILIYFIIATTWNGA